MWARERKKERIRMRRAELVERREWKNVWREDIVGVVVGGFESV